MEWGIFAFVALARKDSGGSRAGARAPHIYRSQLRFGRHDNKASPQLGLARLHLNRCISECNLILIYNPAIPDKLQWISRRANGAWLQRCRRAFDQYVAEKLSQRSAVLLFLRGRPVSRSCISWPPPPRLPRSYSRAPAANVEDRVDTRKSTDPYTTPRTFNNAYLFPSLYIHIRSPVFFGLQPYIRQQNTSWKSSVGMSSAAALPFIARVYIPRAISLNRAQIPMAFRYFPFGVYKRAIGPTICAPNFPIHKPAKKTHQPLVALYALAGPGRSAEE